MGWGMRIHHAAVTRRLSDPDFQGSLVTKCLTLTLGMGALLAVSLIHDAYVWMNPIEPRYFFVDGKNPPRPAVTLDSPMVDDTELLEWTVKAVLAPYNVDYFNYPVELNTASRRNSTSAASTMRARVSSGLILTAALCCSSRWVCDSRTQVAIPASIATAKGFLLVSASPLTRSSYHAGDDFARLRAARAAKLAAG